MLRTFAILTSYMLALASAQDCGEEFRQAAACSLGKVKEGFESSAWAQIDMDLIHEGVNACFTSEDYDCKNILPDMLDMLQMHEEGIDEQIDGAKNEIRERVRPLIGAMGKDPEQVEQLVKAGLKCGMQMLPTLHSGIQSCVRQVAPEMSTFTMPQLPVPIIDESNSSDADNHNIRQVIKGMILLHISRGDPIKQFIFEAVVAEEVGDRFKAELARRVYSRGTCSSFSDAKMLGECIKDAVDAGLPEDIRCSNPMSEHLRFFKAVRVMCEETADCESKTSAECAGIQAELPGLMCSCGQSYLDAEWDDITANITDCMAEELPDDNRLNLPPVIMRGVFKKAAMDMIDEQCQKYDDRSAIFAEPPVCSDAFDIDSFFDDLSRAQKDKKNGGARLRPPFIGKGKGEGMEAIGDVMVGEMVDALGGKPIDDNFVREIESTNIEGEVLVEGSGEEVLVEAEAEAELALENEPEDQLAEESSGEVELTEDEESEGDGSEEPEEKAEETSEDAEGGSEEAEDGSEKPEDGSEEPEDGSEEPEDGSEEPEEEGQKSGEAESGEDAESNDVSTEGEEKKDEEEETEE